MNRIKSIENANAKNLAKEIVRIEKEIQYIIDTNQSNFDVFHDKENGWIIHTSYCQMGGCVDGFISSNCEESAKKLAAEMTFKGLKPNYNGLCSSCREDLNEMQI